MYTKNPKCPKIIFIIIALCGSLHAGEINYNNKNNHHPSTRDKTLSKDKYNIVGIYNILKDENIRNKKGYYKIGPPYKIDNQLFWPKKYKNYTQTGIATWYGDQEDGQLTANGEIFNSFALTAAHRTLPLPTIVRVTNLENMKTIIVKVNDRGPFCATSDRIIDLSFAAAETLGFVKKGNAVVEVELLNNATSALIDFTGSVNEKFKDYNSYYGVEHKKMPNSVKNSQSFLTAGRKNK